MYLRGTSCYFLSKEAKEVIKMMKNLGYIDEITSSYISLANEEVEPLINEEITPCDQLNNDLLTVSNLLWHPSG